MRQVIRYSLIQASNPFYPSKMTIISTHRMHSYKPSASVRHRDVSPKKVCIKNMPSNRKYTKKNINIFDVDQTSVIIDTTQISSTIINTLTTETTYPNCVSGFQYVVLIPSDCISDNNNYMMLDDDDDMDDDDIGGGVGTL